MSQLEKPAFPGGQVQAMQTESGKPLMFPNYTGFSKREVLHIIAATIIYQNDKKLISIREAATKQGVTMEETMVEAIGGFVSAIEKSLSKGDNHNEQHKEQTTDHD